MKEKGQAHRKTVVPVLFFAYGTCFSSAWMCVCDSHSRYLRSGQMALSKLSKKGRHLLSSYWHRVITGAVSGIISSIKDYWAIVADNS